MKYLIFISLLLAPLFAAEPEAAELTRHLERLQAERELSMLRLGTQYRTALERGMQQATQAGNLDLYTALESEVSRFQENPGIDEAASEPEFLIRMQGTYREREAEILREYYRKLLQLSSEWDRHLQQLERSYVQEGDMPKAKATREERLAFQEGPEQQEARDWLAAQPQPNPQPQPERIEAVAGRPVPVARATEPAFLSELPLLDSKTAHGKLGLNGEMGYGKKGKIPSIRGEKLLKSVSMFPPESGKAHADFNLQGAYRNLSGAVGLNGGSARRLGGKVIFRVYGDGRLLWQSKDFKKGSEPQKFKISVAGIRSLRLEAECPGSNKQARTLFIEPKVW